MIVHDQTDGLANDAEGDPEDKISNLVTLRTCF